MFDVDVLTIVMKVAKLSTHSQGGARQTQGPWGLSVTGCCAVGHTGGPPTALEDGTRHATLSCTLTLPHAALYADSCRAAVIEQRNYDQTWYDMPLH